MSEALEATGAPRHPEQRNLIGWLIIAGFAFLMISTQLSAYLTRNPSTDLLRARVEERLQTEVAGSIGDPTLLESDALSLQPKLAGDPETTLLYAAIRTEQKKTINAAELSALRYAKDPVYKAAYQIYSAPKLTPAEAATLAKQVPSTKFLYRLASAQAFGKANDQSARKALETPNVMKSAGLSLLAIGGLTMFGLFLLFSYSVARSQGMLIPKGLALKGLTLPDADRVAIRCSQFFFAYLGVSLFGALAITKIIDKEYAEIPLHLITVGAFVWLSRIPITGKRFTLERLGITKESLGQNVLWGIGGALANLPILMVVQLASNRIFSSLPPPEHPVTIELANTASPFKIIQIALIAAVFAPIVEELMFRATLFPALSAVLKNPLLGGLISSLIFACIHPTGIPAWPGLACIGGMSCFLAYQRGSLIPSMVMHGVHNFGTLLFTLWLLH